MSANQSKSTPPITRDFARVIQQSFEINSTRESRRKTREMISLDKASTDPRQTKWDDRLNCQVWVEYESTTDGSRTTDASHWVTSDGKFAGYLRGDDDDADYDYDYDTEMSYDV
ncbi:unnamed protein product [marine sediment metagenome]|uniref:Uncharacterized protein n=1 Tax=marine sediment metagenome TaxID=412755 RepID=X0V9K4_9ZZZZ